MKTVSILSILLLSYGISLAQPQSGAPAAPKRSDAEQLVALVLDDNASSPAYGVSSVVTGFNRMGDKAALGVFEYLGERKTTVAEESTSPEEVRMILYIIRTSFAAPNIIDSAENGSPKATMVLLKYLGSLPAARAVRDDLQKTIAFVEETKSAASAPK